MNCLHQTSLSSQGCRCPACNSLHKARALSEDILYIRRGSFGCRHQTHLHMLISFVNSRQAALWGFTCRGMQIAGTGEGNKAGDTCPSFKEAVSKKCFQANKPSHFLLTNADTKCAPNIPRMQEMLRSLSCGLAGTLLGHLAPSVCTGKASPARGAPGVLLGQSVGTAAIAVCGEHKSHSREQETRTCCRNNTSVHGETEVLACTTDINQSQKSAAELAESRIKCSPG